MKGNLLLLAVSLLVSLLLLEAGIGLGAKLGLFPIKVPTYSLAHNPIFWRDMNPDFGVWHPAHAVIRHTKGCFDVTYRTNSHGARDAERALRSEAARVVVLGDSMTEGFGVDEMQRFTNLLESNTGIEHLNFGTAADFGTVQYYLLYKALASKFSHSAVLIGMLPDNDFWDNDFEFGKTVYHNRYRPYLVGEYPNYRLMYYQNSIEQSTFRDRNRLLGFGQRFLTEFTYAYNAAAYFKQLIAVRSNPALAKYHAFFKGSSASGDGLQPYSGFYDYRKDQLDLVKYTFQQIKKLAGERQVIIGLLPTTADFKRYDPANPATPLSTELAKFAEANGMALVDLLPDMYRNAKNRNEYILPCDQHWNANGHAIAAQVLKDKLASAYKQLFKEAPAAGARSGPAASRARR